MLLCTVYYEGDLPSMIACANFPGKTLGVSKKLSKDSLDLLLSLNKSSIKKLEDDRKSFDIEMSKEDFDAVTQ